MSATIIESLRSQRGGEFIIARDFLRPFYQNTVSLGLYEGIKAKLKAQPSDITTPDDEIGERVLNYRNEALGILYKTALLAATYGCGPVQREYVIPRIEFRDDEIVQDPFGDAYKQSLKYQYPETVTRDITAGDSYRFPPVPSIILVREGVVQDPDIIYKIIMNNTYRAQGRGIRGEADNILDVFTLDPDNLVLYDREDLQTEEANL